MFIFCGSSSTRQFYNEVPGRFAFCVFSGASIQGLRGENSTQGLTKFLRHIAGLPMEKTLVLMLGNADLDFSYYRAHCIDKFSSDEDFHEGRIRIYNQFLQAMVQAHGETGLISRICVLAPQLTPLRDAVFVPVTAANTGVPVERMQALTTRLDCSHTARLQRTLAFNDRLEAQLFRHDLVMFARIDRQMIDAEGQLIESFYPAAPRDHHAAKRATLPLWQEALRADVEPFDRLLRRRAAQAEKAALKRVS